MLRSLKDIKGYRLEATDGEIGHVHDVLFDDRVWLVRYFAVDTRNWLPGRKVVVSPVAFGTPDWASQHMPVQLTRQQIKDSPELDAERPVSRQMEEQVAEYFAWPTYWANPGASGRAERGRPASPTVAAQPTSTGTATQARSTAQPGDPNLRSLQEVTGYHIHATDDEIGHVEDLIADDEDWVIRYLVVDTRNWLPGRKVLVSPDWIENVEWASSQVHVDLPRETIKGAPEFDPGAPINREYELRLYDYYGRPRYW